MKIGLVENVVEGFVMERIEVVWEVGESLMVMVESDEEVVVGQGHLPTHLAWGRMEPVVRQKWIVVDHVVFGFRLGGCRYCWSMIQLIQLNC